MSGNRVDTSEVLRYLGYAGQPIDDALMARLDAVCDRCVEELEPKGTYRIFDVHHVDDAEGPGYAVEGTPLVLRGHDICTYLEGATSCALAACTLGMESERKLAALQATAPLDAVIYNAAATALIERGADQLEARIVAAAGERGLHAGYRYGPGYGDFDLSIHLAFLDAIEAYRKLGIVATEANLLLPQKSTTAVVGLYREVPKHTPRGCGNCACKDYCTIRAKGDVCYA